MTHQITRGSIISAGIAPAMPRQASPGVLVLSGDELARISGGDSHPTASQTDVTFNHQTASQRAADAQDAYLRS